jgi:sulfite reductase beta subunit-like hemoprotein
VTSRNLVPVEKIKTDSNHLRGTIAEELGNDEPAFGKASEQLIKHHGFYQQDDRDLRECEGCGRESAAQGLLDDAADQAARRQVDGAADARPTRSLRAYGNGDVRLTDRQGIQTHGILKRQHQGDDPGDLRRPDDHVGACGDVCRNVLSCPAPHRNNARPRRNAGPGQAISDHLLPSSKAYYELWLTDTGYGREGIGGRRHGR